MILFKREFKRNFKALLIWTLALGGTIILLLSLYPQFTSDKSSMDMFLKAFPEEMLKAFNMDKISYGTILGYYSVQGFMMVTLVGSIYVVMLSSGILAKEENDMTAEFLLSKPISRRGIVVQKLLAVFVNIIIFNAVLALMTLAGFAMSSKEAVDAGTFLLLALAAPILLHLTFASIAYVISSIMKKIRNVVSLSIGLVFVTYFFNIVAGISDKYEMLKYLTPFRYINTADIIIGGQIMTEYIIIMVIIILLCISGAFMVYRRKDISA